MTCILKDLRQGKGSDGRGGRAKVGNKGQEVSEVWGMTFWMPVVGGAENMYFVGQREEKCLKEEQNTTEAKYLICWAIQHRVRV